MEIFIPSDRVWLRAGAWLARRGAVAVLSALFVAGAQAQVSANWNSIGPAGGTVSTLLTSPSSASTLYAGTPENGVFVSTDAGSTWSSANTGLQASSVAGRQVLYAVYALATDGQFIYAATAAGLFYSPAAAAPSWVALTATGSTTPITLLAFDPNTKRLFAASGQSDGLAVPGVYVSAIDPSAAPAPAWTLVPLPATADMTVGAISIAAAQAPLTPAALLVGVGGNLYTASIVPAGVALNWINGDPSGSLAAGTVTALSYSTDFQQAYACSSGTAYLSGNALDAQAIWLPATVAASGANALNCNTFVSVPIAAGGAPQLALGTDQGAFVSLDGTSFAATGGLGAGPSANAFAIGTATGSMSSTLFVGSGFGVSGVSVSALTGSSSWAPSNGPASVAAGGNNLRLNNASIVDTALLGTTLYGAAVANQYVEVFSSSNGGATWAGTNIASALNAGEEIISLMADTPHSVLFAATTQGLLAYSLTSAAWSAVATTTITGRAAALALGTSALFVGTDNGLFAIPLSASPNATVPVAAGLAGASVRTLLVDGGNVYASTIDANEDSFVFSASEASASAGTAVWSQFGTTSAGTHRITSFLLVGDTLLAATSGNLVLYASSGSSWSSANTSSDPAQQISDAFGTVNSLYSDGVSIYAATGSNGVFVSPTGSTFSWTPFSGSGSTALPSLEVHTLRAGGNTLYAATRAGIASLDGINGSPTPNPPPQVFTSSHGGGAIDPLMILLVAGALFGLRRRRP